MLRNAEEEVVGQLAAVVEHGDSASRVERGHAAPGDELDPALGEGRDQRARRLGRRGHRGRERDHDRDLAFAADAAGGQVLVEQQCGLAGRRRALERSAADADDRPAPGERRKQLGQPRGARYGVELVASIGEPGRRVQVVVGAERDDEVVGVVDAAVGGDAARIGIDRGDRLLQEAHPRLGELTVREADRIERRPPEHHVELGVAEDERVALVDQRHVDAVTERLRQDGRELEPPEPRSEHDDPSPHRAIIG